MSQTTLQTILKTKMTRKEFLLYIGMLVLVISGVSGLLERLQSPRKLITKAKKPTSGFGNGAYGA